MSAITSWRTPALVIVAGVSVAFACLAVVLGEFSIALGGAGSVLVGALLLHRRPGNRVAALVVAFGMASVLTDLSIGAFEAQLPDTLRRPIGIVASSVFVLVGTFGNALFLSYPTGQPRGRWRWVLWLIAALGVSGTVVGLVWAWSRDLSVIAASMVEGSPVTNPAEVLAAATFALMPVSLVSLIARHRVASRVERLQIRWLLFSGITLLAVTVGLNIAGDEAFGTGIATVAGAVTFLMFPAAIGIAITRYHLYEIDRIISRTVSYAAVAGVLGSLFVGIVAGLSALVPSQNSLAVAASTLAVAALFNPVRRRIHHVVDRRFNRARYDAQRTVDDLAGRLRAESDLRMLGRELVTTVAVTLQPTSSSMWLRDGLGAPNRMAGR